MQHEIWPPGSIQGPRVITRRKPSRSAWQCGSSPVLGKWRKEWIAMQARFDRYKVAPTVKQAFNPGAEKVLQEATAPITFSEHCSAMIFCVLIMLLSGGSQEQQQQPGAASSSREQPRAAQSSQEQPPAASSSQKQLWESKC